MKNIVIIGDSLACPRPWIGLGQDDTYASRLQRGVGAKAHVISLAQGERSTRYYADETFTRTYIERSSTDTLIMQLGIVDCAPRLMTFFERGIGFLCGKTQITKSIFLKYVAFKSARRLFFTRIFPNILVGKDEFERNVKTILRNYVSYCNTRRIILINIAFPGTHLTMRSYNVLNIIEAYNDVLAQAAASDPDRVQLLDLFSITRDNQSLITQEDGHHITALAHEIVTQALIERVDI